MPVDIAFGTVKLDYEDVAIPGKVALAWDRRYSTDLLDSPATPLGHGWTCRYYATLTYNDGQFEFFTPQGGFESFPDPDNVVAKGGVVRNLGAYLEIFRLDHRYIVQSWNVESGEIFRYCFFAGAAGEPWRLSSIEDVTGQGVDLDWDGAGRLASVRQRLERRELHLGYNRAGKIEEIFLQAPDGGRHLVMRYEYDGGGRQIAARDAADFADRFEYDRDGRLTREIVKDGGVFHYRYDSKGRCVIRTGLNHYNEKRLRYIDGARVTEVIDSYDRKFTYQYLPSGQAVVEVDPLGGKRTTQYDEHGRILVKTDATGAEMRYTYDELGNRTSVIDAIGHITKFSYNEQHQPLSMTDASGQVWRRAYDEVSRLICTMDPLGHRWMIRYDAEGNVAEIQNPLGARKNQKYTGGLLDAVTDWLGNVTRFRLDSFGRVTERTGPLGETTCFRYDRQGNPIEVILPDDAALRAAYDNAGNLTSFSDGNGQITRLRYGPCQRLLERIDPVGGIVRYVWGSEPGRLDQIINEKDETYTFFRDNAGRIIRELSFDGAERHFKYDAEGYAVAYTNANGETIAIQRDALHRVIGQTLPDGERVSYGFDPIGNLLSAVNADIPVSFERDPLGRILKEVQGEHWVESRYDALGNLIHTATSLGHTVDYQVDANAFVSKLTTLGNQSLEFKRNAYGQETHRQMPGGVVMEQRYDNLGRLIEQRVGPGRLGSGDASVIPQQREIVRRHYSYDHNGSLTSIVDGRWGRVDYVYDPAERLLQAIREQGPSETFAYDAAGNITRMQMRDKNASSDETLVYVPGNRLLQKGSTQYAYDAEGRRIKKIEGVDSDSPKVWLYEWNALDRLKAVTRPDGEVWRYKYDALARRVEKAGSEKPLQFLWNKNVVIHESDGIRSLSAWLFDPFSFAPLATVQNAQVFSVINDQLGTPKELVDSSGSQIWSFALRSWGAAFDDSCRSGNVRCPIRFPGQWQDEESELHYNRFRYYDFKISQYLSPDPIGLNGGWNQYLYAKNPIRWRDPIGLACHTADQQAVLELAGEAKKTGGLSSADATTLLGWAHDANAGATSVGAPQIKVLDHTFASGNNPPPGHFAHEGSQGHVHIGSGHIPVN